MAPILAFLLSPYTITVLILLLSLFITYKFLTNTLIPKASKTSDLINQLANQEPTALTKALISALPENVILPHHPTFQKSLTTHWAQAENENVPSCIVQPSTTSQLSTAIKILKAEFDALQNSDSKAEGGIFAIRSGGHSPVPFSASISGGVLIDLRKFDEVIVSKDEKSVTIGTGCRWGDVSRILDERGLAVVGGRNADVGVGGLVLGGEFLLPPLPFSFLSISLVLSLYLYVWGAANEKQNRWTVILHTKTWNGMHQHNLLRTHPRLGTPHHRLLHLEHRSLPRPQSRFQQLRYRNPLHSQTNPL